MTDSAISRDIALRIALATRAIPDMSVSRLLDILQQITGGDMSDKSLQRISVKALKIAMAGADQEPAGADMDITYLKKAVEILNGHEAVNPVPEPAKSAEPLYGSVRVAIASNDGELLNGHFGSCVRFLIYDMTPAEVRLVDVRSTVAAEQAEDKNAFRADLIRDCQVLFVISIGGPAAAKVIRSGIYPIKQKEEEPARQALARLQQVMEKSPPPWLAKILGASPESRVRFTASEAVG